MTDQELIEGIRDGNRHAFRFLVSKFQQKVIKTAFYFLGCMEDAEDLSQEIFIEIIRSMHTFKNNSTLDTWICRITINKSLNLLKKKRRRDIFTRVESIFGFGGGAMIAESSVPGHSNELTDRENSSILHKAIAGLPENQRIAFILHKFDDQSYKEVAEIMNVTLSSVESLIHRARLTLRTKLAPHFPEYQK